MQGHRLLRAVAVLILIVAFVYLVLALGGALWLGGRGFGSGWGTGWTGWLVLPLAGAAVMAGLTLLVFGLMLFFLARIDDNLTVARQRPRSRPRPVAAPAGPMVATAVGPVAAAVAAPAAAPTVPPVVAPEPVDTLPAAAPEAPTAAAPVEAPTLPVEPVAPASEDVTLPAPPVLPATAADWAEGEVRGAEGEVSGAEGEAVQAGDAALADMGLPRAVASEPAGEAVIPGGVLPSVEITEERPAESEPAAPVEPPAWQAEAAPADVVRAEAAPPDLVLREPVQIEVEAGEAEIGLPEMDVPEIAAPEINAAEAIAPETALPEIAVPDIQAPQIEAPEIAVPDVQVPQVELPEVELPETHWHEVDAREGELFEAGAPEFRAPEVEAPEVAVPQVETPAFDIAPGSIETPAVRLPEVEVSDLSAGEVELPRVDFAPTEPELESLETEGMVSPQGEAAFTLDEEPAIAQGALPQIEVTEVPAATPAPEEAAAALSEATGVPETELTSGVAPEVRAEAPVVASRSEPQVDSLQAEIEALRAQLAALQAQLGQSGAAQRSAPVQQSAPSQSAASQQPAPSRAELVDLGDELPEEPLADTSAPTGRLPGSDEVARIAAEMNALKPKPDAQSSDVTPFASAAAPLLPQRMSAEDNLEIILGVGPIYAKRLREAGITTYQQLAEASYEVLDKVTRGNLERVIKEDWRGQARRLMDRS